MKYIDPDGRDIKDITLYSASVGVLGAVRLSLGVSVDSNGNVAGFVRVEVGIGAGATVIDSSVANVGKYITFDDLAASFDLISSVVDFSKLLENLPDDTGKGNLNELPVEGTLMEIPLSRKYESIANWETCPVEAAFLVGANGDKDGSVTLTGGLKAIAALYLWEGTAYFKLLNRNQVGTE